MRQAERGAGVASKPLRARGDDANGKSQAIEFKRKFVSKKMVALQAYSRWCLLHHFSAISIGPCL